MFGSGRVCCLLHILMRAGERKQHAHSIYDNTAADGGTAGHLSDVRGYHYTHVSEHALESYSHAQLHRSRLTSQRQTQV